MVAPLRRLLSCSGKENKTLGSNSACHKHCSGPWVRTAANGAGAVPVPDGGVLPLCAAGDAVPGEVTGWARPKDKAGLGSCFPVGGSADLHRPPGGTLCFPLPGGGVSALSHGGGGGYAAAAAVLRRCGQPGGAGVGIDTCKAVPLYKIWWGYAAHLSAARLFSAAAQGALAGGRDSSVDVVLCGAGLPAVGAVSLGAASLRNRAGAGCHVPFDKARVSLYNESNDWAR